MTIILAKMLPPDEFEVKFVIVHRSLGTIVNFIPPEYEVIHIPVHNIWCAATLRIIKVIRREKPDAVFSSLLYLNYRLIVAAKICGVKVIVRNNIDLSRTSSSWSRRMVIFTYRWADKVIAQQEEMHDEIIEFTGLSTQKVITLHNPIDTDSIDVKAQEPSPYINADKQLKYVWVARFSREKGHDLLIKALHLVRKKNSNSHLYLVGKFEQAGAFFQELTRLIDSLDLKDYVHLVGFDSNPYRWVKNGDVYVMPSRLEGLPNSLIDAMYLGKPVVATRCIPVIDRIVEDGYNGYVVPSEDVEAMAEAMLKAPELKGFKMTYKPASKEEIIALFKLL